ncbi:variable large family protein (plasmid) [Borreliella tanukii]|uniref:variable large family protein n=1 Tax=Borreliella tanukii TaxID=56146 RepID=UPI003AF154F8
MLKKLLIGKDGAAGAAAGDIGKAASAVTAVSGEQILKAIVEAAAGDENQDGKKANEAKNPIEAAIGTDDDAAAFGDGMKKRNDKIAAAIVLRGVAKDGKFAVANANAANDSKASVKSARKAFGEKGDALKGVTAAAENDANKEAGKLFAAGNNANADADAIGKAASAVTAVSGEQILKAIVDAAGNNANADADAIGKAASAVTAVSGEQILKAIVDAAGDEANQAGAAAGQAKNPIAAAIGTDDDGAAFGDDGMKKSDDKIAAAIVLRGVAKDGKFAVANADANNKASVKSAVESAVSEVSVWLEEMITAVGDAAKVGGDGGGNDKIGDADNKGAVADADSVKGIAKGIKGIVDAAGKAFGKEGNALKDVTAAAENDANADAGKLFAGQNGAAGANAAAIGKAASAVTAVSGEQILKAIVEAAGDEKNQDGKKANEATNPIAAAIGADDAAAAFGNDGMKKRNDKIAAAIVLRGVAKGGKFAVANANAANNKASVKSAVESAVSEVSGWLKEMIKAVEEAAKVGGTGGTDKIGDVGAANKGAIADKDSVKGIAKGIKGIVAAAGKAFGGDALKGVTAAAGGDANADAGKLFASGNGANAADADAIGKAASAVTAVSGEQILKAIVDAAAGDKNQDGKKADEATNPIAAAIGTDAAAAAFGDEMKKRNDKIAAAIVLRGVAKGGKFAADANNKASVKSAVESAVSEVSGWLEEMITAVGEAAKVGGTGGTDKIGDAGAANKGAVADANSVKGIAKGIKGIVDAAGKAFGKEGNALKDVKEAAENDANADAGKLFAGQNGAGAAAAAIGKAASAVTAVSGEQILKAIVEAAAGDEANQAGAAAGQAKNPIEAAIGTDADGAAFGNDGMKKRNDNIAAAIVLRGVAKGGKFAVANANDSKASVKSAVESAVGEVSGWLEEMIKAVGDAAKVGGDGGNDKIGDADNKGAKADANSVKEIAKGIKGIVAAAGKAFGGDALKGVTAAADGDANADAGKLFAGKDGNGAGAGAADIGKAASAVTAVSGEQILKAIVDAAGDAANQDGKKADEAKNPIEAAIGTDDADGANGFGDAGMKKSDKIAAAIVLRGVAKDGKFAVAANDSKASVKSAVESAVSEVSGWLEEMIKAVGEAAKGGDGGGNDKIGDAGADNKGAKADANSVKGIAKGIKGIVAAAGKAFGKEGNALKDVAAAADDDNKDAGKLFAGKDGNAGAGAADIGKAASAVTAVSGEQILKAIVDAAAGDEANQDGKKADEAKNPIAAAIGTDDAAAAFGNDGMKKRNDNIAAAIVLRGVAKGEKFAVANANKASVKSAVESAVDKEIAKGIKGIVDAAGKAFGGDALKDVTAADDDNKEAGKLFAGQNGAGADAAAIGKAASAVTAVSGEQILKAIVEAAAGDEANQAGAAAGQAKNPIEAAIGTDGDAAAFGNEMKKRNDNIAAAIVLRGVAKGGKFAVANDSKASVKSAVESAVGEVSGWLEEMIKAVGDAAKVGGDGGNDKIGDAGADNKGAKADANSVKEIAKGIKGIVDAAGKAFGGDALKGVTAAADGDANADAGKLFAGKDGNGANAADAAAIGKAASAVTAVSGEQILKAIVEAAAGDAKNQDGVAAGQAKNPIAAAIGTDDDGANGFGDDGMKKRNDNIAAAIVLRGVAKGEKFAVAANAANNKASVKSAVESAVSEVSVHG